jgi:hypothetical protein
LHHPSPPARPALNLCTESSDPANSNKGGVVGTRPFPAQCTSTNKLDELALIASEMSSTTGDVAANRVAATNPDASGTMLYLKAGSPCSAGFCAADGSCRPQRSGVGAATLGSITAQTTTTNFGRWMRDNIVGAVIVALGFGWIPAALLLRQCVTALLFLVRSACVVFAFVGGWCSSRPRAADALVSPNELRILHPGR